MSVVPCASGFGRGLPVCAEVPFLVKKGGVWAVFGGFRQVVGRRQHLMGNPQISPDLREISAPTAPAGTTFLAPRHHIFGTTAPHIWAPHIQANPTNLN